MTKRYLIKLTPHSNFFFGGEKTFGQKNNANYLVRSNDFPQQPALLGLVRYQLLLESPHFDKVKNSIILGQEVMVSELIGSGSFDIEKKFDFGKIESISPLFIARKSEGDTSYFFQTINEYQVNPTTKEREFLEIEQLNDPNSPIIHLKGYQPKLGLTTFFESRTSDVILQLEDIFVEERQTGIRKNYHGQTEDNAYYIQFFKRFKSTASCTFSFAFIVELDDSVDVGVLNQVKVPFGAEQRAFKIECEEFEGQLEDLLPNYHASKSMDKIVLVSDAYVGNKDLIAASDFAISNTVDFRFLKTNVETTKNYADLDRSNSKNTEKVTKSEKFSLYSKGSVFYASDTLKIQELLNHKDFQNFRQLGYNKFKLINKQSEENGNN